MRMMVKNYKDSNVACHAEYCDCDTECDCERSYYFTVNGHKGFGSIELGINPDGSESYGGIFFGVVIDQPSMAEVHKRVDYIISLMWSCIG
jgi:hypothetical protein